MSEELKGFVTIPTGTFKELIKDQDPFHILVNCIYTDASLGWNGKYIKFSDDTINAFLSVLDAENYGNILKRLQAEAEEKKQERTGGNKNVSDI